MNQKKEKEKEKARELRKSRWWQNLINSSPLCYYCSVSMDKDEVTMDHIVPLSRGGKSTKGNIVPSCKLCNNKKKDKTASEFFLSMKS